MQCWGLHLETIQQYQLENEYLPRRLAHHHLEQQIDNMQYIISMLDLHVFKGANNLT